jgi:hypothetical protein
VIREDPRLFKASRAITSGGGTGQRTEDLDHIARLTIAELDQDGAKRGEKSELRGGSQGLSLKRGGDVAEGGEGFMRGETVEGREGSVEMMNAE